MSPHRLFEDRAYLGNRRCKHNNFIQFTHSLHESIYTRPLDDIDIMVLALNLDRNRKVGLV